MIYQEIYRCKICNKNVARHMIGIENICSSCRLSLESPLNNQERKEYRIAALKEFIEHERMDKIREKWLSEFTR